MTRAGFFTSAHRPDRSFRWSLLTQATIKNAFRTAKTFSRLTTIALVRLAGYKPYPFMIVSTLYSWTFVPVTDSNGKHSLRDSETNSAPNLDSCFRFNVGLDRAADKPGVCR